VTWKSIRLVILTKQPANHGEKCILNWSREQKLHQFLLSTHETHVRSHLSWLSPLQDESTSLKDRGCWMTGVQTLSWHQDGSSLRSPPPSLCKTQHSVQTTSRCLNSHWYTACKIYFKLCLGLSSEDRHGMQKSPLTLSHSYQNGPVTHLLRTGSNAYTSSQEKKREKGKSSSYNRMLWMTTMWGFHIYSNFLVNTN